MSINFSSNITLGPIAENGWSGITSSVLTSLSLSDSDNSTSWIFSIPKNGSITHVGLKAQTMSGDPPNYNVGLVTIGNDGRPTTTAYSDSSVASYDFTSTGWHWIELPDPATATAGDVVGLRIWPGGTPPDGSNLISVVVQQIGSSLLPRREQFVTSWITSNGQLISFAIKYSDNSIHGLTVIGVALERVDSTTSPDELGNKFSLPFDSTCVGIIMETAGVDSDFPFDVVLYDSEDNILRSISISDEDIINGANFALRQYLYFSSTVDLTNYQVYRIVIKPTTSSGFNMKSLEFESASGRNNGILATDYFQMTGRTDGGSWTDTNTKVVNLALILSSITDPTGGGDGGVGGAYAYVG